MTERETIERLIRAFDKLASRTRSLTESELATCWVAYHELEDAVKLARMTTEVDA